MTLPKVRSKLWYAGLMSFVFAVAGTAFILYPKASPVVGFEPISYIGKSLVDLHLENLPKTPNDVYCNANAHFWAAYNGGDGPEGAFMGWMCPGATELSAPITLPKTLQPGRYYMFVKGIDYQPIGLKLEAGGGTGIDTFKNTDNNKYWTNAIPVDVATATNQLKITIKKNDPVGSPTSKLLLKGIYITGDASELVLRDDSVIKLPQNYVNDDSPAVKGNLIDNSSFEVGLGHGWGFYQNRKKQVNEYLDPTTAYEGTTSLSIPLDQSERTYSKELTAESRAISLKPNKKYTLSAWVKTDAGKTAKGALKLQNTFGKPYGPPDAPDVPAGTYFPQHILPELPVVFTATGTWTRVSITGYAHEYPTADYLVRIIGYDAPGQHLWVDDLQLEEGDATDYAPKLPIELGVKRNQPNNLYYEDEEVKLPLATYNSTVATKTVIVKYEVYDYLNAKVKEGQQTISTNARSTAVNIFDLKTGKRGAYRVLFWLDNVQGSEEEVLYSVVPRPQISGLDSTSTIGIHSNFYSSQFDALQKLGIKWDRVLSPSAFFRWSDVEPVENQIKWFDPQIDLAGSKGVSVMGTLGTNNYWPAWSNQEYPLNACPLQNPPPLNTDPSKQIPCYLPNLDDWTDFVSQTVLHYHDRVKAWEIWNEPNYTFTPAFYAKMMKRAAEAIRRADPNATIVGLGGPYQAQTAQNVITELETQFPTWDWKANIDTLSVHLYPAGSEDLSSNGSAEDFKVKILGKYGKQIWNTETGEWDSGYYHSKNATIIEWGHYLNPYVQAFPYLDASPASVENVAVNFLQSIGNGISKYFYYDSRYYNQPSYFKSHPTIWEYDDTIRPKGIAYAMLAKIFDHATGKGKLAVADTSTSAYTFDRSGTPLAALWTFNNTDKKITLSGVSSAQVKVYDSMGNIIPTAGGLINYGRRPIYIEGQGISLSQLQSALSTGTVSARQDTSPPNMSFNYAPRGPLPSGTKVSISWTGVDDSSLPTLITPDDVQYTYRLIGAAGKDGLSPWNAGTRVDYSGLPDGTYTFEVTGRDVLGNQATITRPIVVGSGSVTPPPPPPGDSTAPTVSLTAPANGATVSGASVAVTASAADNVGVVGVQFKLDGANLGSEDTSSSYSATLNTTTLSNGTHTVSAVARDAAGNSATSTTITVNVANSVADTTPPSAPTGLTVSGVTTSSVSLAWNASTDNVGVAGYKIYRNGTLVTSTASLTYVDTGLSPNTAYSYTVKAYDNPPANNLSSASSTVTGTTSAPPPATSGDLNGDKTINSLDFSFLMVRINKTGTDALRADANHDGLVDSLDFSIVVKGIGTSGP